MRSRRLIVAVEDQAKPVPGLTPIANRIRLEYPPPKSLFGVPCEIDPEVSLLRDTIPLLNRSSPGFNGARLPDPGLPQKD